MTPTAGLFDIPLEFGQVISLFKINNQTNNNMKAIVNTMNPSCPCILKCKDSGLVVMLLCRDEILILHPANTNYHLGEVVNTSDGDFSSLEYFTGTITLSN